MLRRFSFFLSLTGASLVLGACERTASVAPKLDVTSDASIQSSDWVTGDVFVAVGFGRYQVYDNAGAFKETIVQPSSPARPTGCAFNPTLDKLYTTEFLHSQVVVFDDASPHSVLQIVATSPGESSESIVFAADGSFYVGHADGDREIHHYDAGGNLLATFSAATQNRGTDWLELAADQKTMYYTSEGPAIKRFDVGTNQQLADFASVGTIAYALRLLPPGDGSTGLLVANYSDVKRLDGTGTVIQTYDLNGEDSWFALTLDPNGTSFWAGNHESAQFYRFNIASGAVEVGPISTGTGSNSLDAICVKGEPPAVIGINVDIKPGSDPNSINPTSMGVIPVAILGSATFDVTNVDVTTLRFGPAAAVPVDNLTDPATYADHLQDVNLDGFTDLVSHYRQKDTGLGSSDTQACINGATNGGTPIKGCDAVRVLNK
jgi:hypothetical protein